MNANFLYWSKMLILSMKHVWLKWKEFHWRMFLTMNKGFVFE